MVTILPRTILLHTNKALYISHASFCRCTSLAREDKTAERTQDNEGKWREHMNTLTTTASRAADVSGPRPQGFREHFINPEQNSLLSQLLCSRWE